jgi:hypothetical protein
VHLQDLEQLEAPDARKAEAVDAYILVSVHDGLIVPGLESPFDIVV